MSTSTGTIKFGVIGAGQISHSCSGKIKEHDSVELVAAADPNEGRLKELVDKHGFAKSYSDGADLIADPDVDAIYVAVPNKFHAPLAEAALNAGKHVILDKPFAMNIDEALAVKKAQEKSGKLFMLGMNQRYRQESQTIRALVDKGDLGEIYHTKAFWFRRSGIPKFGTWFGKKELAGGGALLDIGVHLLDLGLYAMNNYKPVSVTGSTYSKFGPRGLGEGSWGMSDKEDIEFDVDDFASGLIKFENGASMTLDVSWACHAEDANRNDVHLYGTEAGARLYPAKVFKYGEKEGDDYQVIEEPKADSIPCEHGDRFFNFVNAILGTEEPLTTIDQSLTVQRILDAIYESCKTGNEVKIKH